jgi:hypothetical protein
MPTGIPDTTPGLEDVSIERFKANFKNQMLETHIRHIHNYLILDSNTQWSAQLDVSSGETTHISFHGRRTPVTIRHAQWRANQKHTDWKSFYAEIQRLYPDTMQDTTRILFCYAVVHNLLKASAVEVQGLRRCFIVDVRNLRDLLVQCDI